MSFRARLPLLDRPGSLKKRLRTKTVTFAVNGRPDPIIFCLFVSGYWDHILSLFCQNVIQKFPRENNLLLKQISDCERQDDQRKTQKLQDP